MNKFRNWLDAQIKNLSITPSEEWDAQDHLEAKELVAEAYERAIELRLPSAKVLLSDDPIRVRLCELLASLPEETPDLGTGDLLTVNQAAARFNIGRRTIYRLVERGELAHHRVGSAIRIRPSDLEAYLEGQTQSESLFG